MNDPSWLRSAPDGTGALDGTSAPGGTGAPDGTGALDGTSAPGGTGAPDGTGALDGTWTSRTL